MRFGDTNDGISRSKYTLSVLTLICTVVENRVVGGNGGKKSAFLPAEIRFFNFYKIRLSHSNNTHLPMQFPDENRLSTAAKLDRQICCFTRFTHASHPPPPSCVHPTCEITTVKPPETENLKLSFCHAGLSFRLLGTWPETLVISFRQH